MHSCQDIDTYSRGRKCVYVCMQLGMNEYVIVK